MTEAIVQYLTAELSDEAEAAFEQKLFDGDLDGPDLTGLAELAVALREAAYVGILSILVSRSEMERIRAQGYRILECPMRQGVVNTADLSQDFDLVFLEFDLDLTGVTRLDCEVCDHEGRSFKRNIDLPFDPAGRLSGFCARELAITGSRANPEGMITRFISVEPAGDRVLGEFLGRHATDRG